MNLDAWILIRIIGMILFSEAINRRVDLNRVHVSGAPLQCTADIVSGSGSNDQHICKGRSSHISIQQMRQSIGWKILVSRDHLLVIDHTAPTRIYAFLQLDSLAE